MLLLLLFGVDRKTLTYRQGILCKYPFEGEPFSDTNSIVYQKFLLKYGKQLEETNNKQLETTGRWMLWGIVQMSKILGTQSCIVKYQNYCSSIKK